jgi:anti-repressor protein
MNELIQVSPRTIGDDSTQTVNARDLHAFLEVGKDFSNWIKDRIDQYGFAEGADYAVTLAKVGVRLNVTQKDYHLTLDMAKELAMVERNDKGKLARQYFIECERKAKAATLLIPQSLPEALRLAADLADQKAKAEAALALVAPKAAALDRIALETDGAVCLRVAAKLAQAPEKQFISFLHQEGWIYKPRNSITWMGYSDKEKEGVVELKRTVVMRQDGSEKVAEQVLVTPKGLAKVVELIERKAPWLRKVLAGGGQGALA